MQVALASEIDFDSWRRQARSLAARSIPARDVHWRINGETSLLDDAVSSDTSSGGSAATNETKVPREFVELARKVVLHRSPDRFALLYRVLLRLRSEPHLMQIDVDPDVMRLRVLERQVRHDEHRMHAYVRFRKMEMKPAPSSSHGTSPNITSSKRPRSFSQAASPASAGRS